MSINRVNLSGNLTKSPELRVTQGGTQILTFTVAVNDRRRNPQSGEWEDVANYVGCVVFGQRAEPLSKFLDKGSKVAIEGKLRWSQWEKDGQKRSKLEVVVDEVEFLSKSKADSGAQDQQTGNYTGQQQYAPNNGPTAPQTGYSQPYQQPYQQQYQQQPQQYQQAPNPQQGLYAEDVPF